MFAPLNFALVWDAFDYRFGAQISPNWTKAPKSIPKHSPDSVQLPARARFPYYGPTGGWKAQPFLDVGCVVVSHGISERVSLEV